MKRVKHDVPLFVVGINNAEYAASLQLDKIYRVIPDEDVAQDGDIRVVDEGGEAYLYPADWFVTVKLPFFELLAMLVDEEPLESSGPLERSMMQAIGIEKGKAFKPDARTKTLLSEAARLGGAMARANTYVSASSGVYYYPDRKWQGIPDGMTYTFARDGAPQIDARNNVYYMAAGNSPAMMEKHIGQGPQYLWTYRDADGNYLDGATSYRLHL
jgi:hypothetical protein